MHSCHKPSICKNEIQYLPSIIKPSTIKWGLPVYNKSLRRAKNWTSIRGVTLSGTRNKQASKKTTFCLPWEQISEASVSLWSSIHLEQLGVTYLVTHHSMSRIPLAPCQAKLINIFFHLKSMYKQQAACFLYFSGRKKHFGAQSSHLFSEIPKWRAQRRLHGMCGKIQRPSLIPAWSFTWLTALSPLQCLDLINLICMECPSAHLPFFHPANWNNDLLMKRMIITANVGRWLSIVPGLSVNSLLILLMHLIFLTTWWWVTFVVV